MGLAMMHTKARIRVEVARGTSAAERWVMFAAEGKTHALIVDAGDVAGELLSVTVVRDEGDHLVIELPRAAIAGKRVKVPADSVLEEPPSGRAGCAVLAFVVVVVGLGCWLLVLALKRGQ
jgi:hypothetical protein